MKQKGGIIQLVDAEQNAIYCCLSLLFSPKSPLTLCDPMDCSPPGPSVRGIFLGKDAGAVCHFLLQGIFLTQGSNPGLFTD